ncbi:MAG TPA: F0F1 ATP synthase subunit alpha [Dehalococcoidales bacterium]|nr:MAG: F0F1 ATP synthase subunit alpha [Chloroflexi bacterium RBG_16_60_22]HJX12808.1 F0F1 ATP synthase subunit alpha [Dehalococcoidales bacterium]
MTTRGEDIVSILKQQIEQFGTAVTMVDVGTVIEVGDGIARIHGLAAVKYNELLQFPNDIIGIALNLEEDSVSAVVLGDYTRIKEGDEVKCTGRIAEVPVGEALIGRVVDSLGRPVDGKGAVKTDRSRPIERVAPNVVLRASVDTPVQTGIKSVDSMFPIGRGQRELIIGDRSTGKTAIALDAIVNQKGGDLICIYVAIGQKVSQVARVVATLAQHGAMEHTIVVTAGASDSVALQYLAPYAGCAMGEEFMEHGKDVLIIYDDLSKHAWAYRQLSLLLRRPPGREAYPGDVFYLHSRLLERAAKYAKEYGGGSLTALPIIETQAGDVSAYIPTNVISITDGQLYLESDLFNAGIKPALNVGISVSRVGSKAQTPAMKKVAGRLKLDMGQYREVAAFAQFGTAELDKATRGQLERGQRIQEVLKQAQFVPVALEKQVMVLYAVINGYLDDIPVNRVTAFEAEFHRFTDTSYAELSQNIARTKELDDKSEETLKKAIAEFKQGFAKE